MLCLANVSRSATLCCAFLMQKYGVSPHRALSQVCEGRPVCGPNAGFMEQLEVYSHMLDQKDSKASDKVYQKWLKERYTGEWWTVS